MLRVTIALAHDDSRQVNYTRFCGCYQNVYIIDMLLHLPIFSFSFQWINLRFALEMAMKRLSRHLSSVPCIYMWCHILDYAFGDVNPPRYVAFTTREWVYRCENNCDHSNKYQRKVSVDRMPQGMTLQDISGLCCLGEHACSCFKCW